MNKNKGLQGIAQLIKGKGVKINTAKPAIEVNGFTKIFKNFTSVKDVSFDVKHGVIHGFIGPNGSGKTTTIKTIIGAYMATKGKIFINGEKAGSPKANRAIGYIPERASFPKHLNAVQYLTTMGQLSGMKRKESKEKAISILEALNLSSQAKRKPISFSSGMQKKILLAQALLTDPTILILDEPAANLDPSSRSELFHHLVALKNQGKTIFVSSHVLAELEKIVDSITFIYYGNLLFSGTTKEFNKKSNSVFLKVDEGDESKLLKFLTTRKINFSGNLKTEIELTNISQIKGQAFLNELIKKKIKVISYRSHDLQTSYEKIAMSANKKDKSIQKIEKNIFKAFLNRYIRKGK